MRVNHELINIYKLAKLAGIKKTTMQSRIKSINSPFTHEELAKIKAVYEDLFCYLFDVDEVIINDGKAEGIVL